MAQKEPEPLTDADLQQASIDLMTDYAMVYRVRELGFKRGKSPGRDAMVDSFLARWLSVAMFLIAKAPKNELKRGGVVDREIVACDFDAAWQGSEELEELRWRVEKRIARITGKRRFRRTGEGEADEAFLNDGDVRNKRLDALTAALHRGMGRFLKSVKGSGKIDRSNKQVRRALKYHAAFKKARRSG